MAGLVSYSGSSSEEEPDDALTTTNRKRRADDKVLEEPLPLKSCKADDVSEGICNKCVFSCSCLFCVHMLPHASLPNTQVPNNNHDRQFKLIPAKAHCWSSSFLPRIISDWNCLPKEVDEATKLDIFVSTASSL